MQITCESRICWLDGLAPFVAFTTANLWKRLSPCHRYFRAFPSNDWTISPTARPALSEKFSLICEFQVLHERHATDFEALMSRKCWSGGLNQLQRVGNLNVHKNTTKTHFVSYTYYTPYVCRRANPIALYPEQLGNLISRLTFHVQSTNYFEI